MVCAASDSLNPSPNPFPLNNREQDVLTGHLCYIQRIYVFWTQGTRPPAWAWRPGPRDKLPHESAGILKAKIEFEIPLRWDLEFDFSQGTIKCFEPWLLGIQPGLRSGPGPGPKGARPWAQPGMAQAGGPAPKPRHTNSPLAKTDFKIPLRRGS